MVAEHGKDRNLPLQVHSLVRFRNLNYGDTVLDLYSRDS